MSIQELTCIILIIDIFGSHFFGFRTVMILDGFDGRFVNLVILRECCRNKRRQKKDINCKHRTDGVSSNSKDIAQNSLTSIHGDRNRFRIVHLLTWPSARTSGYYINCYTNSHANQNQNGKYYPKVQSIDVGIH